MHAVARTVALQRNDRSQLPRGGSRAPGGSCVVELRIRRLGIRGLPGVPQVGLPSAHDDVDAGRHLEKLCATSFCA